MKIDKWKLIKSIVLPLAVGGLAGFLSRKGMEMFELLNQPPLSPPGWVFPVVWTVLYTLMGISAYLIHIENTSLEQKSNAKMIYQYQLLVNFLWPIFFFNFQWYLFSFFWLVLLWILVLAMIRMFSKISKLAAYMNIPYFIWLTFAAYLNIGIWWLNH